MRQATGRAPLTMRVMISQSPWAAFRRVVVRSLPAIDISPGKRAGFRDGSPDQGANQVRFGWILAHLEKTAGLPVHSTETPANATTLRHFSVSSAISLPNSDGVIGLGVPPMYVSACST